MSTALDAALAHADAHLDDSVARLKTLVAIKSISTDPAYAGEVRKAADWLGADVPGGEKWGDFEARVASALSRILAGPLPAAIIAHQGVNAHLARLLGGGAETAFQQGYCEILSYELPTDSPNL